MTGHDGIRILTLVLGFSSIMVGAEAPKSYTEHCISCHAANGSGLKKPALGKVPDLRSKRIAAMTDEQLYSTIAQGAGHQAYAHSFLRMGVSEQDLREIVRYIRVIQRPSRHAQ